MSKYAIAPGFPRLNWNVPFVPSVLALAAPAQRLLWKLTPLPGGVRVSRFMVRGFQGLPVPVEVYSPPACPADAPCLLYFHGGGFGFSGAPHHKRAACRYALGAGCHVVLPDYHLLPRYPFPAAREDALAVYAQLAAGGRALGITPARIAVGGDSAGGALAAYVCHLAAARGLPAPCFQMLIYPVTDGQMACPSMEQYPDTPLWNARQNRRMWAMYLPAALSPEERAEASPMEAPLPGQIPNAYVETAEFDCLREEGLTYALRLMQAGAKVELLETKGTIHGYDVFARHPIAKENTARRACILRAAFQSKQ